MSTLQRGGVVGHRGDVHEVPQGGTTEQGQDLPGYSYMYVGQTDTTAVGETLLHDLEPRDTGVRFLPKATWTGRQLSRVRLTAPVHLVVLGENVGSTALRYRSEIDRAVAASDHP